MSDIVIDERAHTVDEALERLGGMSRGTLYRLIREGHIQAHKINRRTIIRQSSIVAYLDTLPTIEPEVLA